MALDLQKANRDWWERNPMRYNWREPLRHAEGTSEFFREMDARFLGSSPFYRGAAPFERWMPFASLKGKRVLEVGCGAGCHAELLSRAGCEVWAVDLSAKAVETARKRAQVRNLAVRVQQMDGEHLAFEEDSFDFVWSWGVIHHSASPEAVMRQVHRVLRPGGEFRLMVYHRDSLCNGVNLLRGLVTGKTYSDGYVARFYSPDQLRRLLRQAGFEVRRTAVLGQTSELIPLPSAGRIGPLKSWLALHYPPALAEALLSRIGSFLFAVAAKPEAAPR